jgi:hypothetical protein
MLSCKVLKIDGVLRRMLIPSEAATLSRGGMAAENTNDVPLIRWRKYQYKMNECDDILAYLVFNHNLGTSTKPATCIESVGKRANKHIDL